MTDVSNWQHQEELKTVSQSPANICTNKKNSSQRLVLVKVFNEKL
jgi:hypothetical protein